MDKLKFGLFDIFVYTIPGVFVVFIFYLLYVDMSNSVSNFIENGTKIAGNISFNIVLLLIFASYILGFALHFFGYNYFNLIKKIFRKKFRGKEQSLSTNEKKFVLVRHYSKENFVFVEQWYTFRGMSFNLSLVFLLIFTVLLIKMILILHFRLDWVLVSLGFFLLSLVTLRRAITFHRWSHETLDEAINTLDLTNKKV